MVFGPAAIRFLWPHGGYGCIDSARLAEPAELDHRRQPWARLCDRVISGIASAPAPAWSLRRGRSGERALASGRPLRTARQAQAAGSFFGVANSSQALPAPIRQAMPSGRMLTSVQVLVVVAA